MEARNSCKCNSGFFPAWSANADTECAVQCDKDNTTTAANGKCECKTGFIGAKCDIACTWANYKGADLTKDDAHTKTVCECKDDFIVVGSTCTACVESTSTDSKTCTCKTDKFKKLSDTITCVASGGCTATSEKDGTNKDCVCATDYFLNKDKNGCVDTCWLGSY